MIDASFASPTAVTQEDVPLNESIDALPAFDALESLSLDLPELPEINWDLDAALPPLDDLFSFDSTPAPSGPIESSALSVPTEPSLGQLEGWLDAILSDRAHTR